MQTEGDEPQSQSGSEPTDISHSTVLTWRVFRARETPTRTVLVTLLIAAVVAVAAVYYGPLMALAAVLVLFLALNGYYLPATYTFDQNGVTTDKLLFGYTRRWGDFRSFVRTTGGIVLSPFSTWSYLDNFRGIHLLLPKDPGPVLEYLAQRLPEKKRPSKKKTKSES